MSDKATYDSLAIVKAAYGPEAVQQAFDDLASLEIAGAKLLLFTDRKFDGRKLVTVRNMEADYPAETVALRNTALMAEASGAGSDYYRDGYEMMCLERALKKEVKGCCLLLRDSCDLTGADTEWMQRNESEPFRSLGSAGARESYLFDCRLELARKAISLTADFYRSGSLLSFSAPSLAHALHIAVEAISAPLAPNRP